MPIALIVSATILAHAAFNGSRLTISLAALALGETALTVGVLVSLFSMLPMLLGLEAGRLVDRIGIRRPLLAAAAGVTVAVLLPGAVPHIGALYVAAAGAGTSFMLFHICIQHFVGLTSTEETRMNNFAWLALAFSISNFLGPTLSGLSIDHFGHRVTFWLLALSAASATAVIAFNRASFPHIANPRADGEKRSALDLLANAELRRVFIVTGLLASAWDLFVFVMPIYGTSIGLSASTIGLVLGCFAAATFIVRLSIPWLSRHVREWRMITMTFAVSCVAYALFPMVKAVPLLAAIAFLLGLGLGATQPSIMTLLYATAPAGRAGEAVGVRSVVLNVSHTFLPLMFGALGATLGMLPVFWSMAAALAAGGWFAERRRRTAMP
jgi:predicted MFS family arabinose efflux permease